MANHTTSRRRTTPRRTPSLAPLWREHVARFTRPGWARSTHIRRALAALLVVLAGVLALRTGAPAAGSAVVVAARELGPGHVLAAEDLQTVRRERDTVPTGTLSASADAVGRTLAAPLRTGETLTDVRLVGPALAAAATGLPNATAVPVRLADADIAELLHPGDTVDVLGLGEKRGGVTVIATGAKVLTVSPADSKRRTEGRVVVLGLPADAATAVAAASLAQSVTVTVH